MSPNQDPCIRRVQIEPSGTAANIGNAVIRSCDTSEAFDPKEQPEYGLAALDKTELNVLERASYGDTVKQAAEELELDVEEVEAAKKELLRKLSLNPSEIAIAVYRTIKAGKIEINIEKDQTINLDGRERAILGYIASGKSTTEIGDILGEKSETIARNFNNLKEKMNANGKNHMIRRAFELGIFEL